MKNRYILLSITITVIALFFYLIPNETISENYEASIDQITFDEVLEKLSNKNPFYLYIEFKEDSNTNTFRTSIFSIAKEKGVKIFQIDNSIFTQLGTATKTMIEKRSTLHFYKDGSKQNEIDSDHPIEEYESFFNNPSGSKNKVEIVDFNLDESIEDVYSILYPIRENGKFGYIDAQGNIFIEPQYNYAKYFSEGLAPVEIGNRYGYINEKGDIVVTPEYDFAYNFLEGFARVGKNSKVGFIDRTGKVVIELTYEDANDFSEGLAPVEKNGKFGYVNTLGYVIIPFKFDDAFSFEGDLALVRIGELSSNPSYSGDFAYINKNGELIIEFEKSAYPGLSIVDNEVLINSGHYGDIGYRNMQGEYVIDKKFDDGHEFTDGIALVSNNGNWGYIDKTGQYVIAPKFDNADTFSDIGLAAVKYDGKYGFINKKGEFVIRPQFDETNGFIGKLAEVYVDDIPGYINVKGEFVWGPKKGD